MTLQDFYTLGFKETYKDTNPARRRVLHDDPYYFEILEYARTFDVSKLDYWDSLSNYVRRFNYYLNSVCCRGNEIHDLNLYFDDSNSERVVLTLGSIILDITYDKETKFIYRIYDKYSYFSSYCNYNEIYEFAGVNIGIKEFMTRLHKARKEDSQKIKNYFNKELKYLHQTYRDRLKKSNDGVKEAKALAEVYII